jgi:hypothetical protein
MTTNQSNLKSIVRGAYMVQKLRIQTGNRIVANFKAKLGQAPSQSEDELGDDAKVLLASLRAAYSKLMDGVKTFPRQAAFRGDQLITTYTELCLMANYIELEKHEAQQFRRMENILEDFPIWNEFLAGIKGLGPAMGGVLVSEIDIGKSKYPSSLWMLAGVDVVPSDGRGRSRRPEHLVDREYVDANGETKSKKSITFNPFLKTKLLGVLVPSFLKCRNERYTEMYYNRKHRLEHHEKYKEVSKGHRHNMAVRFVAQRFLCDLYNAWRPIEGLPVAPEYAEAKLGLKHCPDAAIGESKGAA